MVHEKGRFGSPDIHNLSYVDPLAVVIGRVTVEAQVIIAPHASIRADEGAPFFIGHGTNVQDQVVFHGLRDKQFEVDGIPWSIYIGSHCSIAHCACIHGPTVIGKKTFIGVRSTVWGSVIGRNCYVGFHCLVMGVKIPPNRFVPHGSVILSQGDADILPEVPPEYKMFNGEVVDVNKRLCQLHRNVCSEEL
ncbi:MAG: transferase [Candidatus Moraniibacteriota bacterium]|nr:MAG: transferase [Candidatus Moranbacteria bacterium]